MSKRKVAIILNLIIVILETIGLSTAIINNGIIIMGFYTQESNLILLIASLIYVISLIRKPDTPKYPVLLWKYISTGMVAVTFFVVVFCFIPMCVPSMGFLGGCKAMLINGANLYHHLICPVLSLVSYLFFENDLRPGFKESVYAMLPTLLYAIVSTTLNVLKVIEGPYPFLYVYKQPVIVSVIWFFAIPGGGWLFARLLGIIKSKRMKA